MGWNLNYSTSLSSNIGLYISLFEQDDCTPSKCGEQSECTDRTHIEVEDLFSRYMNRSNVYDRCGHGTRQLHPSCTARKKTANLQVPA